MILGQPKATIGRWILLWMIAGYLSLCIWLFFAYAKPSFLGGNHLKIGADSATYLAVAGVIPDSSINTAEVQLVSISGNLLGPVAIARLIPSLLGIALFDLALFVACLWIANSLPGVKLGYFFWAVALNPLTTPSLLTLNKEILSFFSIMLLMLYISREPRSRILLAGALFAALMARWEQAIITVFFLLLEHRKSPLRGRPLLVLALMVLAITVSYPLVVNAGVVGVASLIGMGAEGNVMPKLNDIQAHYGFPIIFGPKILLNLWGNALRPSYFWTDYLKGDFSDIQNFYAIPFHEVATFILCLIAAFKRKLSLQKASVYWMAIYVVATAATPLFQPRYQFAVYILLCLEISGFRSPILQAREKADRTSVIRLFVPNH
jgi:uncharacterized membrane protein YagU involved in acid resistance